MLQVNHNSIYEHRRLDNNDDSTLSVLKLDGKGIGFVIEDEPRIEKKAGETRIWSNMYELKIKKELTPLTKRYRSKFDWFKYHIEIANIFDFESVYVHIGNKEKDTAGCPCIANLAALESNGNYKVADSTSLYKEWYLSTYLALESGKRVFWKVIDN